jgi:hypothetical protein
MIHDGSGPKPPPNSHPLGHSSSSTNSKDDRTSPLEDNRSIPLHSSHQTNPSDLKRVAGQEVCNLP